MKKTLDLIGIGAGPFNLSLAALLDQQQNLDYTFFDNKEQFEWHQELMFGDAEMQTTYLKDLVTPVDPTNPHSFLNYLVKKGIYYQFINTERRTISRKEFEDYCRFVTTNLANPIRFNEEVLDVNFDNEKDIFQVRTNKDSYESKYLCVGTGPIPFVPECALPHMGQNIFHVKSSPFRSMINSKLNLYGKRVAIIGGGQTGLEIFRNTLQGEWGRVAKVDLVTSRNNLEPLDESPFTNDFFNPRFCREFLPMPGSAKDELVDYQKLASDGNTPKYLLSLYRELYAHRFYSDKKMIPGDHFRILPARVLQSINPQANGALELGLHHQIYDNDEKIIADVVILCTGFKAQIPPVLKNIYPFLEMDNKERPIINDDYSLKWRKKSACKIYGMNLSRHHHGIADPQTSLMAWRSAVILNSIFNRSVYDTDNGPPNFITYERVGI